MTTFGQAMNEDANGVKTTGEYGAHGDQTGWHHNSSVADGADAALGAKADSAVDNPASSGSLIALIKGLLGIRQTEDAAAGSADGGVGLLGVRRDSPASDITDADGDYINLTTDAKGQLRTAPSVLVSSSTTALASALEVKATAGVLHGLVGYVDSAAAAADGFVQVHDIAGGDPAGGAVPVASYSVAASGATQPVQIAFPGLACASGIVIAWSSTGPTFTQPATEPLFITASYE